MLGFDPACPGRAVAGAAPAAAVEPPAEPSADAATREMPPRNTWRRLTGLLSLMLCLSSGLVGCSNPRPASIPILDCPGLQPGERASLLPYRLQLALHSFRARFGGG